MPKDIIEAILDGMSSYDQAAKKLNREWRTCIHYPQFVPGRTQELLTTLESILPLPTKNEFSEDFFDKTEKFLCWLNLGIAQGLITKEEKDRIFRDIGPHA